MSPLKDKWVSAVPCHMWKVQMKYVDVDVDDKPRSLTSIKEVGQRITCTPTIAVLLK